MVSPPAWLPIEDSTDSTAKPVAGEVSATISCGDQGRKNQRRYFCLVHEPAARNLDWRNLMEKMFNMWRENSLSIWAWLLFIAALGIIVYLSVK